MMLALLLIPKNIMVRQSGIPRKKDPIVLDHALNLSLKLA